MSNVEQNPSRYPYRDEFRTLAEALLDMGRWIGDEYHDADEGRVHAMSIHSRKLLALCREVTSRPDSNDFAGSEVSLPRKDECRDMPGTLDNQTTRT